MGRGGGGGLGRGGVGGVVKKLASLRRIGLGIGGLGGLGRGGRGGVGRGGAGGVIKKLASLTPVVVSGVVVALTLKPIATIARTIRNSTERFMVSLSSHLWFEGPKTE